MEIEFSLSFENIEKILEIVNEKREESNSQEEKMYYMEIENEIQKGITDKLKERLNIKTEE
ncbi:MAG: hypothetical protein ACOCP8_05185 [archaeon]